MMRSIDNSPTAHRDLITPEVNDKLYGPPVKTGEIYSTTLVPVDRKPEPALVTWGFPNFAGRVTFRSC